MVLILIFFWATCNVGQYVAFIQLNIKVQQVTVLTKSATSHCFDLCKPIKEIIRHLKLQINGIDLKLRHWLYIKTFSFTCNPNIDLKYIRTLSTQANFSLYNGPSVFASTFAYLVWPPHFRREIREQHSVLTAFTVTSETLVTNVS